MAGAVWGLPVERPKNKKMSANRNTWRRLLRNKGALFGLIVIGAALLVAVVAYFIAPDPSPDANRMIVEI